MPGSIGRAPVAESTGLLGSIVDAARSRPTKLSNECRSALAFKLAFAAHVTTVARDTCVAHDESALEEVATKSDALSPMTSVAEKLNEGILSQEHAFNAHAVTRGRGSKGVGLRLKGEAARKNPRPGNDRLLRGACLRRMKDARRCPLRRMTCNVGERLARLCRWMHSDSGLCQSEQEGNARVPALTIRAIAVARARVVVAVGEALHVVTAKLGRHRNTSANQADRHHCHQQAQCESEAILDAMTRGQNHDSGELTLYSDIVE